MSTYSTGAPDEPLRTPNYPVFDSQGNLIVAEITTSPTFAVVTARTLFATRDYQGDLLHRRYDITPNDQRFVMIRNVPLAREAQTAPVLVLNFFEELKAKVGR